MSRIEIYRSTSVYPGQNQSYLLALLPKTSTSYTDSEITSGLKYYYSIYAVDDENIYSDASSIEFTAQAIHTTAQTATPLPTATSKFPNLKTSMSFGQRNEKIKTLQQMLSEDPTIYPAKLITGYFGNLTREAVKRFQAKHGIEPLGIVGPKTRAKLNELFANLDIGN